MSTPGNGGPAFPGTEANGLNSGLPGMTLRDYFAAKAMQAITSNPNSFGYASDYAKWSFDIADAMLKAREA